MKNPLLFLIVMLLVTTGQAGIAVAYRTRWGTFYAFFGSGSTTEDYIYRYYGNNSVSVTTSSTSKLTSHYNLSAIPLTELNTDSLTNWLMVIDTYTSYQGDE